MKKIFAALASALLVSTAFAQTAAPASSGGQPDQSTQAAGQANLKANASAQPDAAKADAATQQASTGSGAGKTEAKAGSKKTAPAHTTKTKTRKVSKKKHAAVAGVDKTKSQTDTSNQASTAPVKTDGAKTGTTQTN